MFPHIGFFAHTVNLASQKALQVVSLARVVSLGRVQKVVSFFHRSCIAASVFQEKQKMLQLPSHKLLQDVFTRWNSAYDMLSRYLEQQPAIMAVLMSREIRQNGKDIDTLSDSDVSKAEEAVELLKPMKTITTVLCTEKHPTVSMIMPVKSVIMTSMSVKDSDSQLVKQMKEAIVQDIRKRYTESDVVEFLLGRSALDPRFRSLPQEEETTRTQNILFTGFKMC